MRTETVWEDPPAVSGLAGRGRWQIAVEECRANPGVWAKHPCRTAAAAVAAAHGCRKFDGIEAVSRTINGKHFVFIRATDDREA